MTSREEFKERQHTIRQIILRLGGYKEAAKLMGLAVNTVKDWRTYGHIPYKHRRRILEYVGGSWPIGIFL